MNVFGVRPRIAGSKFFPPERRESPAAPIEPTPVPQPEPALSRSGRTVVRLVAKRYDVSAAELASASVVKVLQVPRRMVVLICQRELGYTAGQISSIVNRTRETTAELLRLAEKQMTTDPIFASGVEHISGILRSLK